MYFVDVLSFVSDIFFYLNETNRIYVLFLCKKNSIISIVTMRTNEDRISMESIADIIMTQLK